MHLLTRRGFSLIELVLALVILGIVAGAIYKVLLTNQQTYTAQTQGIDLQQNLRAGAALLPAEFRELNAGGELVADTWQWLSTQFPHVALDEWCLMPDHLHGILVLIGGGASRTGRGGSRTAPYLSERDRCINAR